MTQKSDGYRIAGKVIASLVRFLEILVIIWAALATDGLLSVLLWCVVGLYVASMLALAIVGQIEAES